MFQVKDKYSNEIYTVYGTRDNITYEQDGSVDMHYIEFLVYKKGGMWNLYEWQYVNSEYLIPIDFKEDEEDEY